MTRPDSDRLQDLLDGLLPPGEEAALRRRLASDPGLAREKRELESMWRLLASPLDEAPPSDLESRVLDAIRSGQSERRLLPVPVWLENTLVFVGAAGLAGMVAVGRVAAPEWAGRVVVESARGFGALKSAAVDLSQWDWAPRLFATLAQASATVIQSSATPLWGITAVALAVSASIAAALWRRHRSLGFGGVSNVLA